MPIESKRWEKEFEQEILSEWKKNTPENTFQEKSKKPVFSIDTPPPYVNTPVHVGHTSTYCIMDFIARYKRMKGFNVLFPLGLDRNGLPIEMAAEKKFNKRFNEVPREQFLEMCHKVLEESSAESMDSFYKHGITFNSWKIGTKPGEIYQTDSAHYRSLTQDTFIELYKKGLIYEDVRINNYCPGCQTTIADAEIIYEDKNTFFNDITFKVKGTKEEMIIGTTRPELVTTCGMVIFNPKDDRYQHLEGKTAVTPIFEKEVPIQSHPMAEIDKGTGLAMMCSAGDLSDIRFFREMNLKPIIAIDTTGKMNEHAGFLKGLSVRKAREKMIETLQEKGLLVNQKQTTHRTPVCERSKDEIEFIEMKEYYLKQLDFKEKMKKIALDTKFFADQSRSLLLDWIESISIDWPISRRRYYATEVPLWYCTKCKEVILPLKGKYHQPWREKPPISKCPKCNGTDFKGEKRVLDTWFDSSISPLYILQWSRDHSFFKKNYPCSLRPQGKEIVRTWLYYTLFKCYLLTNQKAFENVWIHHHIVDEHGKKFSKSKGTGVDPKEVLDKFGAEPFRMWVALEGNLDRTDFRCSFERIEGGKKTLTKLWNTCRFISLFPKPKNKPKKLDEIDEWILSEINGLVEKADNGFGKYDFHNPTVDVKHFLWETFSSHYLEMIKSRAYNKEKAFSKEEQESAIWTLYQCLEKMLLLLAPVVPFITHKLYQEIFGGNAHDRAFPKSEKTGFKGDFSTEELVGLNSGIWQFKKEKGLALNKEIPSYKIPKKFKSIEKTLQSCHKIGKIEFS
ncbi:valine--tRNA ligase [Candidatus Micrarchaeota archaeon]|nr:valine--tRNA ligase [Candidatus Micrarchaeota archaeon]MBU1930458.1 valine--tRNA ligase [Candidatus Micrarchaeota archaeon]